MNADLNEKALEFDALRARWENMEIGEERDAVCDLLNGIAEEICATPAADLAGIAAKARAVVWAEDLDLQPLSETDAGFVMAEFVLQLAGAKN